MIDMKLKISGCLVSYKLENMFYIVRLQFLRCTFLICRDLATEPFW